MADKAPFNRNGTVRATDDSPVSSSIFTCPQGHRSEVPKAPCQGPGETCLRMPLPQRLQNTVGLLCANVSQPLCYLFIKPQLYKSDVLFPFLMPIKRNFLYFQISPFIIIINLCLESKL